MKRIIDGKRYDTETATLVATVERGTQTDYGWTAKSLYRTSRGAWFLLKSSRIKGGIAEDDIEAVSDSDVRAWLESHSDQSDCYAAAEKYFGGEIVDA